MAGDIARLCCLLVHNIVGAGKLAVDEFLVLGIDERCKEEGVHSNEGEAPERKPLDCPVGEKRREESLSPLVR